MPPARQRLRRRRPCPAPVGRPAVSIRRGALDSPARRSRSMLPDTWFHTWLNVMWCACACGPMAPACDAVYLSPYRWWPPPRRPKCNEEGAAGTRARNPVAVAVLRVQGEGNRWGPWRTAPRPTGTADHAVGSAMIAIAREARARSSQISLPGTAETDGERMARYPLTASASGSSRPRRAAAPQRRRSPGRPGSYTAAGNEAENFAQVGPQDLDSVGMLARLADQRAPGEPPL